MSNRAIDDANRLLTRLVGARIVAVDYEIDVHIRCATAGHDATFGFGHSRFTGVDDFSAASATVRAHTCIVTSVHIDDAYHLHLNADHLGHLTGAPAEDVESWEVWFGSGQSIICIPGPALAIFKPSRWWHPLRIWDVFRWHT